MSYQTGLTAEQKAKTYLIGQGLTWVLSNFSCRLGEIDLIMRDKDHLVFVEVRARTKAYFGHAIESITRQKRQKILKTASYFLLTHKQYNQFPLRFDVLGIQGQVADILWIKNAFGLDF